MRTKLYPDTPDWQTLEQIVAKLRDGALVIFPTGIGYAYGCSAYKARAIEQVCALKGVDPKRHRLTIMCKDLGSFARYARVDNDAFQFIRKHESEPITYILPATHELPKLLINKKEVGLRLPLHPIATLLIEALGEPLLTASLPPLQEEPEYRTHPELIDDCYGHQVYTLLDGGEAEAGYTAIVSLTQKPYEVLRPSPWAASLERASYESL